MLIYIFADSKVESLKKIQKRRGMQDLVDFLLKISHYITLRKSKVARRRFNSSTETELAIWDWLR